MHEKATTEEEYVTLLEAFRNLVAVAKYAYSDETYDKLLPIAEAEYRLLLDKEAMEGDLVNPALLERITRREVGAGRLSPDDDFRGLAVAGASVFGDPTEITIHRCKQGDWFFYGMAIAAILSALLALIPMSPLWLIALGLVAGWHLNERERKRVKASSSQHS